MKGLIKLRNQSIKLPEIKETKFHDVRNGNSLPNERRNLLDSRNDFRSRNWYLNCAIIRMSMQMPLKSETNDD